MDLSDGVPRNRAIGHIASRISDRTQYVQINRPTESTNALDEKIETMEDHTEKLWITDSRRFIEEVQPGERLNADLIALGLDGIDIQHRDRITHGGVEYTVDTVTGQPEDAQADNSDHPSTQYFIITFTRYSD